MKNGYKSTIKMLKCWTNTRVIILGLSECRMWGRMGSAYILYGQPFSSLSLSHGFFQPSPLWCTGPESNLDSLSISFWNQIASWSSLVNCLGSGWGRGEDSNLVRRLGWGLALLQIHCVTLRKSLNLAVLSKYLLLWLLSLSVFFKLQARLENLYFLFQF